MQRHSQAFQFSAITDWSLHLNALFHFWSQEFSGSSPKRKRAEEKDEGIGSPDILEEEKTEDLRREMIELRQQLEKERSLRMIFEDQVTRTKRLQRRPVFRSASTDVCFLMLEITDAFSGCSVVPRETEGDRPAVPRAAGPNTKPGASAATETAGEGRDTSP